MAKRPITTNPGDEEKEELTEAAKIDTGNKSGMIWIACKVPNGLLLRLFDMIDVPEMTPNGPRTIKIAQQRGEPVKINGSAVKFNTIPDHPIPGGYGLTQVRADFWEEWAEKNRDHDALKNGMLFAQVKPDAAADQARAQHKAGIRSGMEPLDPKKLPPIGLGMKIETATDDVKAA